MPEITTLHFNFTNRRSIPTSLYNQVWDTSNNLGSDFWKSDTLKELKNFLGEEVFEIHKTEH